MEQFYTPTTVEEAVAVLTRYGGKASVIAGGTDLIPKIRDRSRVPQCLVDIRCLPGAREIIKEVGEGGEWLRIGAAVTHAQAAQNPLIQRYATALGEAASYVGSPQIRNLGTVVGNIVNAQPAADTAVALTALGGVLEVASDTGSRLLPVEECYEGLGVSRINSTREVVTAIKVPCYTDCVSSFERLARRKALALPVINVAVWVAAMEDTFSHVRIAVGPVAPRPFRSIGVEQSLQGQAITPIAIEAAATCVAEVSQPRSSPLRGSAAYRREMVRILTQRALARAVRMLSCH